jgi:CcmD family protein
VGYLFSAYFVLWAGTFGYLFFLGTRQKRLQRELELLRQEQQTSVPPTRESP